MAKLSAHLAHSARFRREHLVLTSSNLVCVNFKTGRHRTAALKRARPRGGAPRHVKDVCVARVYYCMNYGGA